MADWTSVEDKLPRVGRDIWATDGVEVEQGFRSAVDKDDKHNWCDFPFVVTHWMPYIIPRPPKQEPRQ